MDFYFKKSFTFENRTPFEKPHTDQSGQGFTTRESRLEESFNVNVGTTTDVPAWVADSEHFQLALSDGNIVPVEV